jgi:hypothetical protein
MSRVSSAVWLGVLLATPALVPAADGSRGERDRIARERAEVRARYAERAAECREQFVVTACIERARAERRESLDHLDAQQRVLDDAERKRRAGERLKRIRGKVDKASDAERSKR